MAFPLPTIFALLVIALCAGWLSAAQGTDDASSSSGFLMDNDKADVAYYEQLIRQRVIKKTLQNRKPTSSEEFKSAKPFSHIVNTNMFPKELLRTISKEVADYRQSVGDCIAGGTCNSDGIHQKAQTVFSAIDSFGPATDALNQFLRSASFLSYLQSVTGIDGLVVGQTDKDAGVYQTLPGGFEKVHSDYNMDKPRSLHRRIAVYLYLNPDWRNHYGGHLELWSRDAQQCETRISPDLGTMVVFATTDFSFHGHQTPLTCPPNRSHRKFALYYYASDRPSSECLNDNCFLVHQERYPTTRCPACDGQCYKKAEK